MRPLIRRTQSLSCKISERKKRAAVPPQGRSRRLRLLYEPPCRWPIARSKRQGAVQRRSAQVPLQPRGIIHRVAQSRVVPVDPTTTRVVHVIPQ
jgi:hypothetical protein